VERYQKNPALLWRSGGLRSDAPRFIHQRGRAHSDKLQYAGLEAPEPVWQKIQRALDDEQNDLLRAAFTLELLELVEPAG